MPEPLLRDILINRVFPRVQAPGQYIGGEWNSIVKDPRSVGGRFCLAFPEPYTIGMSHHGLQVLYAIMNSRDDWACERAFTPLTDLETLLRDERLPLVSLESFTPLREFDVVGFILQHELSATNVLTMLDLSGIPLAAETRTMSDPLVLAGGDAAVNPEPMARFIDAFVLGDGEEALPEVCDRWLALRRAGRDRAAALLEMTALPYLYVPRFYEPQFDADGRPAAVRPARSDVPAAIQPAIVRDLDAALLSAAPIVPWIECVKERVAIEIMRGCFWRCRYCQAPKIKQPVRFRRVETIVAAAERAIRATGCTEIALLGPSSSVYPQSEELLARLHAVFRPLGVRITMPSEELRRAIDKPISDDELLAGCCRAMENGVGRIKLDFMCGLPGEQPADLDGIIDLAEEVSRLGKQVRGSIAAVVANIGNFIPRPHTPYEWLAMQTGEYFDEAHERMRRRKRMRSVTLRFTDVESTLIEAALCRGDRRFGEAIEFAWQRGARLDASSERLRPWLWHEAFTAAGIDLNQSLHLPCPADARLPWEHIGFGQGCGCQNSG